MPKVQKNQSLGAMPSMPQGLQPRPGLPVGLGQTVRPIAKGTWQPAKCPILLVLTPCPEWGAGANNQIFPPSRATSLATLPNGAEWSRGGPKLLGIIRFQTWTNIAYIALYGHGWPIGKGFRGGTHRPSQTIRDVSRWVHFRRPPQAMTRQGWYTQIHEIRLDSGNSGTKLG